MLDTLHTSHTFSKVSALVYFLCKVTENVNFQNLCTFSEVHSQTGEPTFETSVVSAPRHLLQEEKRPIIGGKETYYRRKRDLLQEEKRPIIGGKETYNRRKRDLL
jgi:hypothetical protein